jgi:pilus assembly protein CpaE
MNQAEEQIQVLIVDDIAETRENLRKLLSFEPDLKVVGAAASGQEGIELAKQYQPHIVLMDINMPGMDGITATKKLMQEVPTAQVVMLSVQGETDYLRRAMLAGARDYLTKPASADELMNTIRRVYEMGKSRKVQMAPVEQPQTPQQSRASEERKGHGDVVAVFSPKGGCGCTTVAVNLAVALQQLVGARQRIGLLDASLQFGDVGVMLDLHADRNIADLVPRLEAMDSDMLSGVMAAHGSGIKVLLAPPRPEEAESFISETATEGTGGSSAFSQILTVMREQFDTIVVDTWSWIDDVVLTIFDVATLIILVVTPNIPAIKSARLFLEVADKLDYPMDKVVLVVNGTGHHGSIQVAQIEKAMKSVEVEIPYDERTAMTAANRGVPFVVSERNRPISERMMQLARSVGDQLSEMREDEEEDEEVKEAAPGEPKGIGGTGLLRLKQVFDRG